MRLKTLLCALCVLCCLSSPACVLLQILRLFSQSASQITGLREDLKESRGLLGVRHKQLHQLWYRSITLRNIITLLDLVENVSKAWRHLM